VEKTPPPPALQSGGRTALLSTRHPGPLERQVSFPWPGKPQFPNDPATLINVKELANWSEPPKIHRPLEKAGRTQEGCIFAITFSQIGMSFAKIPFTSSKILFTSSKIPFSFLKIPATFLKIAKTLGKIAKTLTKIVPTLPEAS
jgi:hypothetical protein